jgi:GTPase
MGLLYGRAGRLNIENGGFRPGQESGRTSAVSQQIMGFTSTGEITNHCSLQHKLTWGEIVENASKVITFFDLAGHEKYLKTTVFGMTGHQPDYCMLMIGGNMGVMRMTKEHLGLAISMQMPSFIVITKVDIAPQHVLEQTIKVITRILKSNGAGRKMPTIVKHMDDVVTGAANISAGKLVPIFLVSNVSGEGLDLLKAFLNLLPSPPKWEKRLDKPPEFQIDENFSVTGIGTVVSGTVVAGRIHMNDELLLGPDTLGNWQKVGFKGIHNKRVSVQAVQAGQSCSCPGRPGRLKGLSVFHSKSILYGAFVWARRALNSQNWVFPARAVALKKVKRDQVRKGMVMLAIPAAVVRRPLSLSIFISGVLPEKARLDTAGISR